MHTSKWFFGRLKPSLLSEGRQIRTSSKSCSISIDDGRPIRLEKANPIPCIWLHAVREPPITHTKGDQENPPDKDRNRQFEADFGTDRPQSG